MTTLTCKLFFSDCFKVDTKKIDAYGALNVSVVNDLPLFIDPFLLFNSKKREYKSIHDEMIRYLVYLKELVTDGQVSPGTMKSLFTFPEIKQNWLGFSKDGNNGRGLGLDFAKTLITGFQEVFGNFGQESLTKASHIEKLCILKPGIGKDFLSDFTTNMSLKFLAEYTEKFSKKFISDDMLEERSLRHVSFNFDTETWESGIFKLPVYNGDFILLTPKDILTREEAWINSRDLYGDFQGVLNSLSNIELRDSLNKYFHKELKKYRKLTNEKWNNCVKNTITFHPELVDHYISQKESKGNEAISVAKERVGYVDEMFVKNIIELLEKKLQPKGFLSLPCTSFDEAKARLLFLKDVLENKGGFKIFYNKGKPVQREEDAQILYRLTWVGTAKNISREVNDGRGPVDFMASVGAFDKTLIEFKLAKNRQLMTNLKKQCPTYELASNPTHPSISAIFYFTKTEFARVNNILKKLKLTTSSNIILIDCRKDNKISGSKVK